jgi:hypothetical protein
MHSPTIKETGIKLSENSINRYLTMERYNPGEVSPYILFMFPLTVFNS